MTDLPHRSGPQEKAASPREAGPGSSLEERRAAQLRKLAEAEKIADGWRQERMEAQILEDARRNKEEGLRLAEAERGEQERQIIRERHMAEKAALEQARVEARQRRQAAARRRGDEKTARTEKRLRQLRNELRTAFQMDFLSADQVLARHPQRRLLTRSAYLQLKVEFVREWSHTVLGQQLDEDQAAAVAEFGGNVRVTARAGSGKTRVLVTRALFLVKHCGVAPRSLLLLAFNKRAVHEIVSRLRDALDGELPHVMTFHALAYALVRPEQTLIVDDPRSEALGLSRVVQAVIDEHIQDPAFSGRIRSIMLQYFREDLEAIAAAQHNMDSHERLEERRALTRETLRGEFVKSYGEKLIANVLFEHGVEYKYEPAHRWGESIYRPDFEVRLEGGARGIAIEYFGLAGDPVYDAQTAAKRAYWNDSDGWTLLELTRDTIARGPEAVAESLCAPLGRLGIAWSRRSEDEIWASIKVRAIDRFTTVVRTFVSRCRKAGHDASDVQTMLSSHRPSTRAEADFLTVAASVHRGFLARLRDTRSDDFDGLMWEAIRQLDAGETRIVRHGGREQGDLANLRYVLIDEFQDFSEVFFRIASGIRKIATGVQFFCVGDDWQAINGFAGSELRYFEQFNHYFDRARSVTIRSNYRSSPAIVDIGNALMSGLGTAAHPVRNDDGEVWRCDLASFRPSALDVLRHRDDELTPIVLRLVRRYLARGEDVVLLSRLNGLPRIRVGGDHRIPDRLSRFRAHVCSFLPEHDRDRVTISTAHGFKGLESHAVVVLDALVGSYPLINPSWVFMRVFGDSPEAIEQEERRLFYVALTRASRSLALLTDASRPSPYLEDIRSAGSLKDVDWEALPTVPSLGDATVEIRVLEAFPVREELRKRGFWFRKETSSWSKQVPALGDLPDRVRNQAWFRAGVRVEVRNEEGDLMFEERSSTTPGRLGPP